MLASKISPPGHNTLLLRKRRRPLSINLRRELVTTVFGHFAALFFVTGFVQALGSVFALSRRSFIKPCQKATVFSTVSFLSS